MEEMVELVMPHMIFDIEDMKLQTTKNVCRNIVAGRKDIHGIRTTFAMKQSKNSLYVDIDNCKNAASVRQIEEQLREKEEGIAKSRIKARNRRLVLEGQISMEDYMYQQEG